MVYDSHITITVYGVMVPMLRVKITINPERYNCVSELKDVLAMELQSHLFGSPDSSVTDNKGDSGDVYTLCPYPKVIIPPWTKLFFKSSRGGYIPRRASHFINAPRQRVIVNDTATVKDDNIDFCGSQTIDSASGVEEDLYGRVCFRSTNLGLDDTFVEMSFKSLDVQEVTLGPTVNIFGDEKHQSSGKEGKSTHKQIFPAVSIEDIITHNRADDYKDYFNDFIQMKDTSVLGDGDEVLIEDWADIVQMTVDRKNEELQMRQLNAGLENGRLLVEGYDTNDVSLILHHGGDELVGQRKLDNSTLMTGYRSDLARKIDHKAEGYHELKLVPFILDVKDSDNSNMTENQKQNMALLDKFLRETMLYHIKMVMFLSGHCNKEAVISAQDIANVQSQNVSVAESLIDKVIKETKITDPCAIVRILTQLAVQHGKEQRELNEKLETEKMKQLLAVYKVRIERLEKELSASENIVEELQLKLLKVESDYQYETSMLKEELRTLEEESNKKSNTIHNLERASLLFQENKELSDMNERLFEELLNVSDDKSKLSTMDSDASDPIQSKAPALLSQGKREVIQQFKTLLIDSRQHSSLKNESPPEKVPRRSEAQAAASRAVILKAEDDYFRDIIHRVADQRSFSEKVSPFMNIQVPFTKRMQEAEFQNNRNNGDLQLDEMSDTVSSDGWTEIPPSVINNTLPSTLHRTNVTFSPVEHTSGTKSPKKGAVYTKTETKILGYNNRAHWTSHDGNHVDAEEAATSGRRGNVTNISTTKAGSHQGTGLLRLQPRSLFDDGVLPFRSSATKILRGRHSSYIAHNVNEVDKFMVQFYAMTEAGDTRIDAIEIIRGTIVSTSHTETQHNRNKLLHQTTPKSFTYGSKSREFSLNDECAFFDEFFFSSSISSCYEVPISDVNELTYSFDIRNEGDRRTFSRDEATYGTYNIKDPSSSFIAFYWMVMRRIQSWTPSYDPGYVEEEVSDLQLSSNEGVGVFPQETPKKHVKAINGSKCKRGAFQNAKTQILRALPNGSEDDIACVPTSSYQIGAKGSQMDFFKYGFILFFRIYYVRYGKRNPITCDRELQRFLDPRCGPHYSCSLLEVSNAEAEFTAALKRRGVAEHPLLSEKGEENGKVNLSNQLLSHQHFEKDSFDALGVKVPETTIADEQDEILCFRNRKNHSFFKDDNESKILQVAENCQKETIAKKPFFKPRTTDKLVLDGKNIA